MSFPIHKSDFKIKH